MKYLVAISLMLISFEGISQIKEFDNLEMLFDQGHYRRVYRKSKRLLDKPEYDYSMLPMYYKSISLLQLCQNYHWLSNHPEALGEAEGLFLEVKNSPNGEKILNAHMYEVAWLKKDMTSWISDLKRMGYHEEFRQVQKVMGSLFGDLPEIDVPGVVNNTDVVVDAQNNNNSSSSNTRESVVQYAEKHMGVPYVWAGNSPDGFDCSGFTSYVLAEYNFSLPRRSEDQYNQSKKVKKKDVQKGDLIFFSNGSGISHVGIVVSEKGQPLEMIHSSSSKGIIKTEVEKSEYWMKRLHGFGTYLN